MVALTPGTGSASPAQRDAGRRADAAARPGVRRLDAVRRAGDQVDAFTYRGGALSQRQVVVDDLPDARSPELGGEYAHALKSVASRLAAVYVSVGSTATARTTGRHPEQATDPAGAPRRRHSGSSPAASGAAPVWPSTRGARCGRPSTTATTSPTPTNATSTATGPRTRVRCCRTTSTTTRSNRSPASPRGAISGGRTATPTRTSTRNPGNRCPPARRPLVRDVQTSPDGLRLDCAALAPMERGMGAHSAPLGLSFAIAPGRGSRTALALVGVRLMEPRAAAEKYGVSFFPWRDGTLEKPARPCSGASRTTTGPTGAVRSWQCRARPGRVRHRRPGGCRLRCRRPDNRLRRLKTRTPSGGAAWPAPWPAASPRDPRAPAPRRGSARASTANSTTKGEVHGQGHLGDRRPEGRFHAVRPPCRGQPPGHQQRVHLRSGRGQQHRQGPARSSRPPWRRASSGSARRTSGWSGSTRPRCGRAVVTRSSGRQGRGAGVATWRRQWSAARRAARSG